MIDVNQVCESVAKIISAIGHDPSEDSFKGTPLRVARMYEEIFSGIGLDPKEAFTAVFEEDNHDIVLVRDVSFFSMCEHHFLPFFGVVHMGYIPNSKIAGASKLVRALEIVSHRPQMQERMGSQLASSIFEALGVDGVAVIVDAEHLCMTMRGVRNACSRIVTLATRGPFTHKDTSRSDLISLLRTR